MHVEPPESSEATVNPLGSLVTSVLGTFNRDWPVKEDGREEKPEDTNMKE